MRDVPVGDRPERHLFVDTGVGELPEPARQPEATCGALPASWFAALFMLLLVLASNRARRGASVM
jgi:hypothetical protein